MILDDGFYSLRQVPLYSLVDTLHLRQRQYRINLVLSPFLYFIIKSYKFCK